jgi:hypothetical protein
MELERVSPQNVQEVEVSSKPKPERKLTLESQV